MSENVKETSKKSFISNEPFAKLFDVDGKQLLIFYEFEGEEIKINQMVNTTFGSTNLGFGSEKIDELMKVFEAYDQEKAEAMMEKIEYSLRSMFSDQGEEEKKVNKYPSVHSDEDCIFNYCTNPENCKKFGCPNKKKAEPES